MYIVLITIHVIVCLILISVILLQAGRGGGLTEMVGGDSAQSFLGTQAPVILKKATTGSAIAFLVTSLVLGMVTARRGRSIFETVQFPSATGLPQTVGTAPLVPVAPVDVSLPDVSSETFEPFEEVAPKPQEAQPAVDTSDIQ